MDDKDLISVMTAARYKILVAIRPLLGAKLGYDMVLAEMVSNLHKNNGDGETIKALEGLKFND